MLLTCCVIRYDLEHPHPVTPSAPIPCSHAQTDLSKSSRKRARREKLLYTTAQPKREKTGQRQKRTLRSAQILILLTMVDYRKFDNIDVSDDEEEKLAENAASDLPRGTTKPVKVMTKKGTEGRYKYEYQGRTIYEWEQTLEEVNIYVNPPPGVPRNMYDIEITHSHLRIGLKGASPFIDEDTGGPVKVAESMWTMSDGILNVNLQKMIKAEAWDCALRGRDGEALDAFTKEEVKKKLMLERFQEEVSAVSYDNLSVCMHVKCSHSWCVVIHVSGGC